MLTTASAVFGGSALRWGSGGEGEAHRQPDEGLPEIEEAVPIDVKGVKESARRVKF